MSKFDSARVGVFDEESWEMIIDALLYFVQEQTAEMEKRNLGDKEWQWLSDYETLVNDIQLYVVSQASKTKS